MLNLLRLIRRKEHIDDTATAYIEGRATERDEAAIAARASVEPGLKRDLDSIRDTVALLRSIEPAKAPRSFMLQEAPVRVRRTSRPRLATVPAVFAIAAAAVVGLLAIGNLTDIVHQSNGMTAKSESSRFSQTANSSAISGNSGVDSADAMASPEMGLVAPMPTSIADSSSSGSSDITAMQPEMSETEAVDDGSVLAPTDTDEPYSTRNALSSDDLGGGIGEGGVEPVKTLPLPEASIAAGAVDITQDLRTFEQSPEDSGDGFALPLWQLQIGFAFFAVVMAGAWMILHRRLTR